MAQLQENYEHDSIRRKYFQDRQIKNIVAMTKLRLMKTNETARGCTSLLCSFGELQFMNICFYSDF